MLDVSRHFHPKEYVLQLIDYLAMHKMNIFHWHLTDDQGWRVEIKSYPRLTEVGAWRVDRGETPWTLREQQQDSETASYGGFYTQDDIREVIAYAQSRYITIIPEIEMPGHCLAALASYPQYSCSGGPFKVPPGSVWPIKDVYCPGNDETFAFLEGILGEVADLFPSPYIHIGGDEVDKATWKAAAFLDGRMIGTPAEEKLFRHLALGLPSAVEFAVSEDGKDYAAISTSTNDISPLSPEPQNKEFSAELTGKKARFVRVQARTIGVCPDGHPGAGNKAWLFADEIIVE
jgi:N-acetyl-beta-hexosaminidase